MLACFQTVFDISICIDLAFFSYFDLLTIDPQITHKLSIAGQSNFVNKLCITFMLLGCNDKNMAISGLLEAGFLPTMKFQLSQLP